jgi:hypothetical protein
MTFMRVEHGHPRRLEILSWTSGFLSPGMMEGHTTQGVRAVKAVESLMDGADTARYPQRIGLILILC